jgi:hypothetical protein
MWSRSLGQSPIFSLAFFKVCPIKAQGKEPEPHYFAFREQMQNGAASHWHILFF